MKTAEEKKLKINRKLKAFLLVIFTCLFALSCLIILRAYKNPGMVTAEEPVYSYDLEADIDYRVNVLPNPIYPDTSLGKGQYYLTPYVNNITADMTYAFKGERPAEYKGSYEVVGLMQGIEEKLDIVNVIWTKEYQLLPPTEFEGRDSTISIKEQVPINFQTYNQFVEQFSEDTKINLGAAMTVMWKVNLEAVTDRGPVKEETVSTMTIPLNRSYFQIGGDLSKTKEGAVTETVEKLAPVEKSRVVFYGILAGLSVLALIFINFFTVPRDEIDPVAARLRKIFKAHGERMVALGTGAAQDWGQTVPLSSLDDLVKIADELGKPIMYREEPGSKNLPLFFVFDEPVVYVFDFPPS